MENKHEASEIIADFTLSRIPAEIRATFTEEQILAIRQAVIYQASSSRHTLAIRFTVPLFFRKYYVAFFFGRDRRRRTVESEKTRIEKTPKLVRNFAAVSFVTIFGFGIISVIFVTLYLLKYALGVDLFPETHLRDMIDLFMSGIESKK